jgi:hypothetical protein
MAVMLLYRAEQSVVDIILIYFKLDIYNVGTGREMSFVCGIRRESHPLLRPRFLNGLCS